MSVLWTDTHPVKHTAMKDYAIQHIRNRVVPTPIEALSEMAGYLTIGAFLLGLVIGIMLGTK